MPPIKNPWHHQRNRTNRVTVTLDDDERATLERAAAEHPGGVGGYLREAGLAAAGEPASDSIEAIIDTLAARVLARVEQHLKDR